MKKRNSSSRDQRRLYEKYLRKTNFKQYKEWKADSIFRGSKIHQSNVELATNAESEFYEGMQTKIITSLKENGKSNVEIDLFIEDWVQTIKVWRSKERPLRMHELEKQKLANSK